MTMSMSRRRGAAEAEQHPQPAPRSLTETIEALLGPIVLADLSFPHASFAEAVAGDVVQTMRLPRSGAEQDFLARFKQAGGRAPIAAWNASADGAAWPPPQIAPGDACVVVGLESLDAVIACGDALRRTRSPILVPAPAGAAAKERPGLRGYRITRLIERNGGASFLLLSPGEEERPTPREAADIEVFDARDSHVTIDARAMIHDGGYASEGDAQYSWLWTGPSPHVRLVAPHARGSRPRLVELCVPRTEDPVNLDRVAVQVDGRPVRHSLDRWSETSGKIGIEIPSGDDYAVLTLIVPRMTPDGDSGRLLGLCIDKMIVTP